MRSYNQYCSVAKALDVIGERWNLLIVRELLLRERCRYTDLRHGLPGIASNLLADRLRDLERAGIVFREDAPPPIATTLFGLTERGKALEPVLRELAQWGAPFMIEPASEDLSRSHWLALPVELYLTDHEPSRPPIAIEVITGDEPIVIETIDGNVRARPGRTQEPDLVLRGAHRAVVELLTGMITLAEARAGGLSYEGELGALRRVAVGAAVASRDRAPAAARAG